MAQRDGAAVEVDRRIDTLQQAKVLEDRNRLRREGLIQFDGLNVLDGQACRLERLLGGRHRPIAHDGGVTARNSSGQHTSDGLEAQRFGALGTHHRHARGAHRQRGGGTCRHAAALGIEHRLEVAHGFHAGIATDDLIAGHHHATPLGIMALDADDLVIEAAFIGGGLGTLVRAHAELILLLTTHAMHLAEQFRGQAHHHRRLGCVLAGRRVDVDPVCHRHVLHVLDTANDIEVSHAGLDVGGGDMQGTHRGTTQAVDRLRRYGARNAGHDGGITRDVHGLLQGLVDAAPDDVVDLGRHQAGIAIEQRLHHRGGQILGAHMSEGAILGLGHGGTHAIDDYHISRIQIHCLAPSWPSLSREPKILVG